MKINVKDFRNAEDKEQYIRDRLTPEEQAKAEQIDQEKWQIEEAMNGRR